MEWNEQVAVNDRSFMRVIICTVSRIGMSIFTIYVSHESHWLIGHKKTQGVIEHHDDKRAGSRLARRALRRASGLLSPSDFMKLSHWKENKHRNGLPVNLFIFSGVNCNQIV